MSSLSRQVEKLCALSRDKLVDVYSYFEWPDGATFEHGSAWFTSPALITLYQTPIWERMSDAQRKRLSFFEAVNFYSLNIHGERALMEGLAARIYLARSQQYTSYLHHFLDEENKHSALFGTFCMRYAGKIYPDKKIVKDARDADPRERDLLFFAKAFLFEQMVDVFNVIMSRDPELHPIARAIHHNHHVEEARHLAFGRCLVRELCAAARDTWGPEKCRQLADYLLRYVHATWLEYFNTDVYADAFEGPGWPPSWELRAAAWKNPAMVKLRADINDKCAQSIAAFGLLEDAPEVS